LFAEESRGRCMRWFVVASVAVWSASALAADVSDGGVIPLPPVVVPLGAADVPNASSRRVISGAVTARASRDEVTVFSSIGPPFLDLVAAWHV
ncbi:MAG: hypothetical protein Q8L14_06955, partial [Myxococcales bacterium]|nr:hypothetical protein [Myxococcales bacterium]